MLNREIEKEVLDSKLNKEYDNTLFLNKVDIHSDWHSTRIEIYLSGHINKIIPCTSELIRNLEDHLNGKFMNNTKTFSISLNVVYTYVLA
jgi:tRNA U34 5-carboxymethylaminomethyl modifying GTPase MnmE/TrmE